MKNQDTLSIQIERRGEKMVEMSSALSAMMLQQQVQLSVASKAMDFQEVNANALIEQMAELPQAQDPIRGQNIDFSV